MAILTCLNVIFQHSPGSIKESCIECQSVQPVILPRFQLGTSQIQAYSATANQTLPEFTLILK
jgi:hypothetical protein